jgi:hypothetical protein
MPTQIEADKAIAHLAAELNGKVNATVAVRLADRVTEMETQHGARIDVLTITRALLDSLRCTASAEEATDRALGTLHALALAGVAVTLDDQPWSTAGWSPASFRQFCAERALAATRDGDAGSPLAVGCCFCLVDCRDCSHSGEEMHTHAPERCPVHPDALQVG